MCDLELAQFIFRAESAMALDVLGTLVTWLT